MAKKALTPAINKEDMFKKIMPSAAARAAKSPSSVGKPSDDLDDLLNVAADGLEDSLLEELPVSRRVFATPAAPTAPVPPPANLEGRALPRQTAPKRAPAGRRPAAKPPAPAPAPSVELPDFEPNFLDFEDFAQQQAPAGYPIPKRETPPVYAAEPPQPEPPACPPPIYAPPMGEPPAYPYPYPYPYPPMEQMYPPYAPRNGEQPPPMYPYPYGYPWMGYPGAPVPPAPPMPSAPSAEPPAATPVAEAAPVAEVVPETEPEMVEKASEESITAKAHPHWLEFPPVEGSTGIVPLTENRYGCRNLIEVIVLRELAEVFQRLGGCRCAECQSSAAKSVIGSFPARYYDEDSLPEELLMDRKLVGEVTTRLYQTALDFMSTNGH